MGTALQADRRVERWVSARPPHLQRRRHLERTQRGTDGEHQPRLEPSKVEECAVHTRDDALWLLRLAAGHLDAGAVVVAEGGEHRVHRGEEVERAA